MMMTTGNQSCDVVVAELRSQSPIAFPARECSSIGVGQDRSSSREHKKETIPD